MKLFKEAFTGNLKNKYFCADHVLIPFVDDNEETTIKNFKALASVGYQAVILTVDDFYWDDEKDFVYGDSDEFIYRDYMPIDVLELLDAVNEERTMSDMFDE